MVTDRVNGFTVTLERDLRDDDATPIADAIRQLRGVIGVTAIITEPGLYNVRFQERLQIRQAIMNVFEVEV